LQKIFFSSLIRIKFTNKYNLHQRPRLSPLDELPPEEPPPENPPPDEDERDDEPEDMREEPSRDERTEELSRV
jgi:hypothetical protein